MCCWPAEIDACDAFDCTDGVGFAFCEDVLASSGGRNNNEGRTCSCRVSDDASATVSDTQYYANDTAGCIGEWAPPSCCGQYVQVSSLCCTQVLPVAVRACSAGWLWQH